MNESATAGDLPDDESKATDDSETCPAVHVSSRRGSAYELSVVKNEGRHSFTRQRY